MILFCGILSLICVSTPVIGQEIQTSMNVTTDVSRCAVDQFQCKNGDCIDELQECDMLKDCSDSSDELQHCETYKCESGEDIPTRFHCDGYNDCSDNSDEENCKKFDCQNGKTVTQKQVCDQIDDCGDKYRSDECNCAFTFTCANGRCISSDLACDDINDCGDNSDEDGCPTTKFTCFNGQKIETNLKCDGKGDCDDTSDECVCMGTFTCDNQRCISTYLKNDGKDDCGDGSDEAPATQTAAPRQEEVTSDITDTSDESSGLEIDAATSVTPNQNVTVTRMTSPSLPTFICANEMIVESELLCDGIDDCEDGYRSDECDCNDTFVCGGESVPGRKRCVPADSRCDGINDCFDRVRSDECGCDDTFTCSVTKECIPKSKLCDGIEDCDDGSDENPEISGCPALKCGGGFLCGNGQCLNMTEKCNDVDDCGDCSDEMQCKGTSSLFHCKNGGCIENQQHCDGKNDCPDADDEADCFVNEPITSRGTTTPSQSIVKTSPSHPNEQTVTQRSNSAKNVTPHHPCLSACFFALSILFPR